MRRFSGKQKKNWGLLLSAAVFIATILLFWAALGTLSRDTAKRQREQLETALQRGILTCYALEGRYPESLSYLEEHYPLHYNKDRYFIDYRIQGANLLPDVTIIERGE